MIDTQNALYLTVDSLRKDRVTDETMPHLAQLAEDGVWFEDVAATAPATAASFVGLQASRYYADVDGIGLPEREFTTLGEAVPDEFQTMGISTNQFTSAHYQYDRGFDRFDSPSQGIKFKIRQLLDEDGALFKGLEWGYQKYLTLTSDGASGNRSYFNRPAESVNDQLLSWVEDEKDPFFAWLHHMDVHHPYEPPTEYLPDSVDSRAEAQTLSRGLPGKIPAGREDDLQRCIELYEAECRHWDDAFYALYSDLPDDTLIVVVGDHGELLGEHNRLGHPHEMWEELVNVPLIIYHPDLESRTIESQQSTLDLAPTILSLLGADVPGEMRGEAINIESPDPRDVAYGTIETPEHVAMARTADEKWLRHESRRPTQENHGELLLSRESEKLADDRSTDEAGRMRELREAFTEEIDSDVTAHGRGIDESVRQHLADLGYAEEGYHDAQEAES